MPEDGEPEIGGRTPEIRMADSGLLSPVSCPLPPDLRLLTSDF
jgi:hypothetical protein